MPRLESTDGTRTPTSNSKGTSDQQSMPWNSIVLKPLRVSAISSKPSSLTTKPMVANREKAHANRKTIHIAASPVGAVHRRLQASPPLQEPYGGDRGGHRVIAPK